MQQRDAFRTGGRPATHQISKRDQRCLLPLKGSVNPRPHSRHSPQETLPCEDVGWEGVRVLLYQALLYLLPLDLKELPVCSAAWPALWAPQLQSSPPGQLLQFVKLLGVKRSKQSCAAADLLRWQACNCLEDLIMLQPTGSLKSPDELLADGTATCCLRHLWSSTVPSNSWVKTVLIPLVQQTYADL